jgi:hypothetical protein
LESNKKSVLVVGTSKLTSWLRLSTRGEYVIEQAKRTDLLKALNRPTESIFILTEGEARRCGVDSLPLLEIAAYPIRVRLPKLFLEAMKGNARSYIESCKVHCYAVPLGSVLSLNSTSSG